MYTRCLICRTPFPKTGILETLPRGSRVAFDLQRGRLWMICRSCRRWSLLPLDSRWETLEELDHLTGGTARPVAKTSNVALFRAGALEVVRIGSTELPEEAWWRFGRKLPPHRPLGPWGHPFFRRLRFGRVAWMGALTCGGCGFRADEIPYADRQILLVRPERDRFVLIRPCPRCKDNTSGGLRLTGVAAELTLARILAFQHEMGESRVTVQAAARLVQESDGAGALARLLTRYGKPLGALQPLGLTALDITVAALRERTLMRLEVEALQARWRREEELAALVDGELSPLAGLDAMIRRVRGR